MVDSGTQQRYGPIAISTPCPFTRQLHVHERHIAQEKPFTREKVADLGQKLLSAVTLLSAGAVHQRDAQRHLCEGYRKVITGSLGNPEGIFDLLYRAIIGSVHAIRYCREVDVGDDRGVRQGVGGAAHGNGAVQVVVPSGMTEPIARGAPRRSLTATRK
jgi:hypothetical protein